MYFKDRAEAGKMLASKLSEFKGKEAIVYALPRGGVSIGYEIAKFLGLKLDLVIVRKIGHPGDEEFALCVVSENGERACSEDEKDVSLDWLKGRIEEEKKEIARRRVAYAEGKPRLSCFGKVAIVVDDGVATGLTMISAINEIKKDKPKEVMVAVPVCSQDAAERIKKMVDQFVCLDTPGFFMGSVGAYYENFPQLGDEDVIEMTKKAKTFSQSVTNS